MDSGPRHGEQRGGSRPQALGSRVGVGGGDCVPGVGRGWGAGGWIKALRVEEQWEAVGAEAEVWGEVG